MAYSVFGVTVRIVAWVGILGHHEIQQAVCHPVSPEVCLKGDPSTERSWAACAGITFIGQLQLVSFCVFEFAVGVFWPSMMKMRSQHVPEEMRATVINLFRIPLNAFVCVVLHNVRISLLFCKANVASQHTEYWGDGSLRSFCQEVLRASKGRVRL